MRLTVKRGSDRAPGSEGAHVEIRGEHGLRTDPNGNPATRKGAAGEEDLGNIDFLKKEDDHWLVGGDWGEARVHLTAPRLLLD